MNKKGFTLVEIIFVMLLIAIISTLVVPSTSLIKQKQLEVTTTNVYTTVKLAQQMAHYENKKYEVWSENDYIYILEKDLVVYKYKVPEGIKVHVGSKDLTNPPYRISFSRDMSPDKAGTITIIDEISEEKRWVTIRPATGKVTIYEEEWEK